MRNRPLRALGAGWGVPLVRRRLQYQPPNRLDELQHLRRRHLQCWRRRQLLDVPRGKLFGQCSSVLHIMRSRNGVERERGLVVHGLLARSLRQ